MALEDESYRKRCRYHRSTNNKQKLDITNITSIEKIIAKIKPEIILNCAAYTYVDDAEDI